MNKFKVGDRVRYNFPQSKNHGDIGTVVDIDANYGDPYTPDDVLVKWDSDKSVTWHLSKFIEHVYKTNVKICKRKNDNLDLIVKIERMLMDQDKYWSINYIPSANAYGIYISTEESEDDE